MATAADTTAQLVIMVAGPLLALVLICLFWQVRAGRRNRAAAEAYLRLAHAAHRLSLADASRHDRARTAAAVAAALSAAARLHTRPLTEDCLHGWLSCPVLAEPRRLLAHHGTVQSYGHAQVLDRLADHPERPAITTVIRAALR